MTRPSRWSEFLLLRKGKSRCVDFADLRYNRANETTAEDRAGSRVAIGRASVKREQLVSRRSRRSQWLCPSSLLRIESAYRHRP